MNLKVKSIKKLRINLFNVPTKCILYDVSYYDIIWCN